MYRDVLHLLCISIQLKTLHHVGKLTQLRDLNISKCANVRDITELQKCSSLQCLNLSGLKLSHHAFCVLEGKDDVYVCLCVSVCVCVCVCVCTCVCTHTHACMHCEWVSE